MISTVFSQSLSELRDLLKREDVEGLDDAYYEASHQRFEGVSSQRSQIAEVIKGTLDVLNSAARSRLNWLSVGCGAGHLDLKILESRSTVGDYVGLDPNAEQLEKFKTAAKGLHSVKLINARLGDWDVPHRFDLVTAVHVLYYVDSPTKFVESLLSAKADSGICLVAIAPRSPMNLIAELFWRKQSVDPVFTDDVESILTSLDVRFSKKRIDANIPLSCLVGALADQMVIDFTVQAKTANISPKLQAGLESAFTNAAIRVGSVLSLEHPVDILLLQ